MSSGKTITILLLTFTLILLGCSDSATDTELSDPPELPELQQYQPSFEYFSDAGNGTATTQAGLGYSLAAELMNRTVSPLFSTTAVYMPFFNQAKNSDATFNNGVWEWTYTYSQAGQSAEIRLTAEPDESTGDISWALYISTSGTDGPDFENYRFMDGTTSGDGSEGSWSIYPYQENATASPVLTFDWTREDENNYTASYTFTPEQVSGSFSIDFTQSGAERTLDFSSSDGEFDVVVFWNTDTKEGYINRADSERICWNSSLENVSCQ
ncbi:MAG: hypothetical protein R3281_17650 [Balneolaceae bacterium]|nr:hypothetical protein [Balneolaceae bacterium]